MTDIGLFATIALVALASVFLAEAVYALFFRNFGLVTFRLSFEVPKADTRTVWSTYFDGLNEWNSVTERLSYDVVSEAPNIVRSCARMRGTRDKPVTSEWRIDVTVPGRSCRATVIRIDGAEVPASERTYEVFEVVPTEQGTSIKVEAGLPVRGWLRVPLHRRFVGRIFEDLRMACLRKAGVPFTATERRGWFSGLI